MRRTSSLRSSVRSAAPAGALAALVAGFLLAASACSSPHLDGTTFSCATDADCSGGKICGTIDSRKACVLPEGGAIRVGLSAPLQGPSQDLGTEMRRGIEAMFKGVNDSGGIFGRRLELESMNDNYDPATAVANVKQLLDIQQEVPAPDSPDIRGSDSVLALLGNVGTPPMLLTAPIANKNGVIFFAPFTGAQKYLRDGTNSPYVFNYRAGYYQETAAIVDYLQTFRAPRIITGPDSYKHLLVFTQHDSYGDSGYSGLINAYNTRVAPVPQPDSTLPNPTIARVMYEREDVSSVDPAIVNAETFLTNVLLEPAAKISIAILMIDTYQPGNKFIRAVKDWINADVARASRLDVLFVHVSFVGSDALAQALTSPPETYVDATDASGQTRKTYADGVMVTQVVPYYHAQAPGITAYRNDIARYDSGTLSFTSLEGYIAARLFVEALKRNGRVIDDQSLTNTLNTNMMNVDIGIGTLLGFTSTVHQASQTVWGSRISNDGSFTVPFVWDPTNGIVPGSS